MTNPSAAAFSVARALVAARDGGVERLDAQLMLGKLLQQSRAWLIAHGDEVMNAAQAAEFAQWIKRRRAGEPLAYVLGEQVFCGLRLRVGPQVLIPRPETELLVDWGLELLAALCAAVPAPRVVDLGCGSGAIALALKHRCPAAQVSAIDASPEALAVADRNARELGLSIMLRHGSWWAAVSGQSVHLAVSNPPYIAPGDAHLAALQHEPQRALVAGDGGLADLHQLIDGATGGLHPGGWLLLEHGHDQGAAVRLRLLQAGFTELQTRRDLAGLERCSGGRLGTRTASH